MQMGQAAWGSESARKEEVRKRASVKRESDEHSALVISASLGRVSALGKTKRKNPQNFQFEYPFITAGICLVCWSDSPDKERGKKCTGSSSYLSPPLLLLVDFHFQRDFESYPVYVGVYATKVTFSLVSSVISVNHLTFLSGWVMILS